VEPRAQRAAPVGGGIGGVKHGHLGARRRQPGLHVVERGGERAVPRAAAGRVAVVEKGRVLHFILPFLAAAVLAHVEVARLVAQPEGRWRAG
jgi:hypothetical protein